MPAGRLRDRICLVTRHPARDGAGQPCDLWEQSAPIWADVRQIGGREQLRAGLEVSEGLYSIRIRYRPGVNSAQQILLLGLCERLDIKAVQLDQGRAWLTISAERLATTGRFEL